MACQAMLCLCLIFTFFALAIGFYENFATRYDLDDGEDPRTRRPEVNAIMSGVFGMIGVSMYAALIIGVAKDGQGGVHWAFPLTACAVTGLTICGILMAASNPIHSGTQRPGGYPGQAIGLSRQNSITQGRELSVQDRLVMSSSNEHSSPMSNNGGGPGPSASRYGLNFGGGAIGRGDDDPNSTEIILLQQQNDTFVNSHSHVSSPDLYSASMNANFGTVLSTNTSPPLTSIMKTSGNSCEYASTATNSNYRRTGNDNDSGNYGTDGGDIYNHCTGNGYTKSKSNSNTNTNTNPSRNKQTHVVDMYDLHSPGPGDSISTSRRQMLRRNPPEYQVQSKTRAAAQQQRRSWHFDGRNVGGRAGGDIENDGDGDGVAATSAYHVSDLIKDYNYNASIRHDLERDIDFESSSNTSTASTTATSNSGASSSRKGHRGQQYANSNSNSNNNGNRNGLELIKPPVPPRKDKLLPQHQQQPASNASSGDLMQLEDPVVIGPTKSSILNSTSAPSSTSNSSTSNSFPPPPSSSSAPTNRAIKRLPPPPPVSASTEKSKPKPPPVAERKPSMKKRNTNPFLEDILVTADSNNSNSHSNSKTSNFQSQSARNSIAVSSEGGDGGNSAENPAAENSACAGWENQPWPDPPTESEILGQNLNLNPQSSNLRQNTSSSSSSSSGNNTNTNSSINTNDPYHQNKTSTTLLPPPSSLTSSSPPSSLLSSSSSTSTTPVSYQNPNTVPESLQYQPHSTGSLSRSATQMTPSSLDGTINLGKSQLSGGGTSSNQNQSQSQQTSNTNISANENEKHVPVLKEYDNPMFKRNDSSTTNFNNMNNSISTSSNSNSNVNSSSNNSGNSSHNNIILGSDIIDNTGSTQKLYDSTSFIYPSPSPPQKHYGFHPIDSLRRHSSHFPHINRSSNNNNNNNNNDKQDDLFYVHTHKQFHNPDSPERGRGGGGGTTNIEKMSGSGKKVRAPEGPQRNASLREKPKVSEKPTNIGLTTGTAIGVGTVNTTTNSGGNRSRPRQIKREHNQRRGQGQAQGHDCGIGIPGMPPSFPQSPGFSISNPDLSRQSPKMPRHTHSRNDHSLGRKKDGLIRGGGSGRERGAGGGMSDGSGGSASSAYRQGSPKMPPRQQHNQHQHHHQQQQHQPPQQQQHYSHSHPPPPQPSSSSYSHSNKGQPPAYNEIARAPPPYTSTASRANYAHWGDSDL